MLRRVEDVRVFESSDDVILRSSIRRYVHQQLHSREHAEIEEDEQLHPQHPYRMRKRVLQRESEDFQSLNEKNDQVMVSFNKERNRPMEFVFLSSGEIRAREDCPPGLGLPELQQEQDYNSAMSKWRLEYQENSEESEEEDRNQRNNKQVMQMSRQQVRQPSSRQHNEQVASSLSSSSDRSMSSESDDADVSSDDSGSVASKVSERVERKEERVASHSQVGRQATRNTKHGRTHVARNNGKRTPIRSLKLNNLHIEVEDEMPDHSMEKDHSAQPTFRENKTPPSAATPRESRQRSAPLNHVSQVSQSEDTNGVPTRRTKRSPKMEVSHLISDEPTPKPKGRSSASKRSEENMTDRLEAELQKEKKRVLEKMNQLLDEQGKNQRLRNRVEELEAQLAANNETSNKIWDSAREKEESMDKEQAARINALEEQVRLQEAKIARLKQDKEQLKTALKQLKKTGNNVSNDQRSDAREVLDLRAEVDDITRRLNEFLAKVERWKNNSKKEMQRCDDKTSLPAVLEHVWLDFPQFPGGSAKYRKESLSPTSDQQQQSTPGATDEQGDAVLFLKKRLRQREDELQQIHVKYVELKELCARQCVREADLQNFINEHRLRGNLIIRKSSGVKPNAAIDNQEQEQDDHQDEQRPSAKLKMISSRGTNTPASYNEQGGEEDNFVNDEYSDNQEDNDDKEEEYEYPVRAPKIFVRVGRDGVYEHASPTNSAVAQKLVADRSRGKRKTQSKQQQRVERIRLVPSPSLAQRYERVPTPTTTNARRKKSPHQPLSQSQPSSRSHPPILGECPPGCGSRPSFMRRKTPTAAARAVSVKRPIATTVSKGAIGVIRPWM